jgi:hypothetical protein
MKRLSVVPSTMRLWKTAFSVLAFVALPALARPAKAADAIKITYAFFQNPVEIPGGKVLPPGNYAFKMLDESGPSKVIQMMLALEFGTVGTPSAYNANKPMPVVATLIAVPDYLKVPVRGVVTYWQIRDEGPRALRTVSFALDPQSLFFVYPRERAAELAKAANQPVPSMMASDLNGDVSTMKNVVAKATSATGDVDISQVFGKPGDHPPAEAQLPEGVHYPPGCTYESGEVSCKFHGTEARN